MIYRLFVFALLFLVACKTTQKVLPPVVVAAPPEIQTTLQITSLKANDLEETLTQQDEVLLAYSLTAIDTNNRMAASVNGTWGVEKIKQGGVFEAKNFVPIALKVPTNGKIVASVVLVEIDDYQTTQRWLKEAQKVSSLVSVPAVVLEVGALLTPLKYVSAGLVAAGAGFELTQKLDGDDVLGQFVHEISFAQALRQPLVRVAVPMKGKHALTNYHYNLTFEMKQTRLK